MSVYRTRHCNEGEARHSAAEPDKTANLDSSPAGLVADPLLLSVNTHGRATRFSSNDRAELGMAVTPCLRAGERSVGVDMSRNEEVARCSVAKSDKPHAHHPYAAPLS
jgi:hypothetical protein